MTGLSPPFHFDLHLMRLSVFFIALSTELTNSELGCHEQFIYFQNNCYYFSSQPLPFLAARHVCNNLSDVFNPCHLTSIHSEGENNFVYQRATQLWGTTTTYWLGAVKPLKRSNFSFWLDGTHMNFTQLKAYSKQGSCLQQCTKESDWEDAYCLLDQYYVCKQTAICKY
ncbi:Snaclec jerdonuxin subunit alpha [Holothuria leucospilota]|uniref:Snaclec jerdonuxin subunit alpha n=1 Tax=Holothuria leucospilota TaxID=206669 RepID=A0A9Q1C2H5_HOLLE|nr:Snaclec jerdonuxin subunit alpha [Holothuria leucospilota]